MGILELLIIVLIIAWVGGFSLNVAGSLIHLLLLIAIVLIVIRLFRKAV